MLVLTLLESSFPVILLKCCVLCQRGLVSIAEFESDRPRPPRICSLQATERFGFLAGRSAHLYVSVLFFLFHLARCS